MPIIDDIPLFDSPWSQARFVAAAKAIRPEAWERVESLNLACDLVDTTRNGMASDDAVAGQRRPR